MKYGPKYNRLHILDLYDEDWTIDRNGNLVMREDDYPRYEDIPMESIEVKDVS